MLDEKEMNSILPNVSEKVLTPVPPSTSIDIGAIPSPVRRKIGTTKGKLALKNAISLISKGSISGDNVSIYLNI